ncbi:hypothetical protein [Streptomyces sp. TBY4]|uniref:hypothetical protein n=1 Tax=Streptomyces sp. TBY4 TaxID=2962030 RepID=UPI0020B81FD4|nr:hypothetical protein [Streptomyces sp. TBY4]MCP3755128.1 hypothetical protein [Streptomyces sp. TBY4]
MSSSSAAGGGGGTSPTPPSGPSGTGRGGRRGSGTRLGEWAALISAVAAVAGVALGFLGLPALIKSPTARPVPTETVYVTVTPSAPAAPGPGPSASGPGASTPPPPPGATTTLTLPKAYGFRLREAVPVVERVSKALDFYRDSSNSVWADNGGRIVALEPREPGTLDTCRAVTRFVEKIPIESLQTGARFCFETGKGALALVEVPKDGDAGGFVVLNVTLLGTR